MPIVSWMIRNPTVAGATIVTSLVALRIVTMARLNPSVAIGILDASGAADIAMGTLLGVTPYLALPVLLALIQYWREHRSDRNLWSDFVLFGIATMGVPIVLTAPVVSFIAYGSTYALAYIVTLARAPGGIREWRRQSVFPASWAIAAGAVVMLMMFVVWAPPWMPSESLTTSNGAARVGYALEDEGDWLSMLSDETRIIVRIRNTDVASRTVCTTPASRFAPSLVLTVRADPVPLCPVVPES